MKLLSRILGSVRVLEVTLTAGGYTVRTWSCKPGGIPQQVDQVPESVARSIVAVTFAGHGVISKSSEATGVSARVRSDAETFVWNEREGVFSFVRREKLRPVLGELAGAGIYPQCLLVAEPPEDAARTVLGRLRWRMLVRPTAEGSALAQAVVRRMGLPILGLFLVLLDGECRCFPVGRHPSAGFAVCACSPGAGGFGDSGDRCPETGIAGCLCCAARNVADRRLRPYCRSRTGTGDSDCDGSRTSRKTERNRQTLTKAGACCRRMRRGGERRRDFGICRKTDGGGGIRRGSARADGTEHS